MVRGNAVPLLSIQGLHARVGGREVLRGIDLSIASNETHVLLGPNGSGKTTLLNTILGMPGYEVLSGTMTFKGIDLLPLPVDERARLGIGIAFQRPPAVRGVKLRQVMEVASNGRLGEAGLALIAEELDLSEMLDRDVNMGFREAKQSARKWGSCLRSNPIWRSSTSPSQA